MWKGYVLGEVAGEVKRASNGGEVLETVNGVKSGVVGDLVTTTHSLEHWHGDVGQIRVGNKGEGRAGAGQVWCHERGEVVLVESEGSVDRGQGWHHDLRAVAERHVGGPLEVGEIHGQVLSVGLNVEEGRDVANLSADGLEVVVVVDVEGADRGQVDAIEGAELGVGDEHIGRRRDTLGEGEGLESWESGPGDGSNRGQSREGQGGEDGEIGEGEDTADGAKLVSGQGSQVRGTLNGEGTRDLFNAVQGKSARNAGCDDDGTADGCAGCESSGISLALDRSGGLRAAAGLG